MSEQQRRPAIFIMENFPLQGIEDRGQHQVYTRFMQEIYEDQKQQFQGFFLEQAKKRFPKLEEKKLKGTEAYQLYWSKPTCMANNEKDTMTLSFKVMNDALDFDHALIELPLETVHELLHEEWQKSCALIVHVLGMNDTSVNGQPKGMIRAIHHQNLLNCEKFTQMTGMKFAVTGTDENSDETNVKYLAKINLGDYQYNRLYPELEDLIPLGPV